MTRGWGGGVCPGLRGGRLPGLCRWQPLGNLGGGSHAPRSLAGAAPAADGLLGLLLELAAERPRFSFEILLPASPHAVGL